MFFLKDPKKDDEVEILDQDRVHKAFFEEMSYRMRDPLNAVCGISEIIMKNLDNDFDKESLSSYAKMLYESANELKQVMDECFSKYEDIPVAAEETNEGENYYELLNNLRIMVVEDSDVNSTILKEMLDSYGAIVTPVTNGKEAVDLFTKSIFGTYDVILMDIKMPVMDGYEATDRIRKSNHSQAKSIPIIAVTGDAYADDIKLALQAGMDAHVAKPYNFERIYAALKGVLK